MFDLLVIKNDSLIGKKRLLNRYLQAYDSIEELNEILFVEPEEMPYGVEGLLTSRKYSSWYKNYRSKHA